MRVALPRADAAARRVDEDAVAFRPEGSRPGARPDRRPIVEHRGPRSAPLEDGQAPDGPVRRPDQALVPHQVGKMEGFSPLTGAGVPPGLARLRRAGVAHELRGKILDLEGTRLEARGLVEVLGAAVPKRGEIRRRSHRLGEDGPLARAQAPCDLGGRAGFCADPEHGLALELSLIHI